MVKYHLDDAFDFSYYLLGISSHFKDYRLCWSINKALDLALERIEPGPIEISGFSMFEFHCPETDVRYELISNRNEEGYLLPEVKQADFFLKIEDHFPENIDTLIEKLRSISMVNIAFIVETESLPSKNKLLFS